MNAHLQPMLEVRGTPDNKIWLIGDSNPANEAGVRYPLDPRHPTRHSIWTPILDVIQETVYPLRLDTRGHGTDQEALYVRNAVRKPAHRQDIEKIGEQLALLRELVDRHRPLLILTFGGFAFHLCQAALEQKLCEVDGPMLKRWKKTSIVMLQREFSQRIIDSERTIVPLLHQSVARSFNHAHDIFCGTGFDNYFDYTGTAIGQRLLRLHLDAPLWRAR